MEEKLEASQESPPKPAHLPVLCSRQPLEPGKSCRQTKPMKESQPSFLGWVLYDLGYIDQSYRCHHLSINLQGDKYCLTGSQHME